MKLLVTGGAGYVGAELVPKLLQLGHEIRVLDLFIFGDPLEDHPRLERVKGDLRDERLVDHATRGMDAVLHLAAISNDPSFDLDPALGRSINFDAFRPLVAISKKNGLRRFVYVSTSSVYGVSDRPDVTEDHPLVPLTDYNKYKALCEPILLEQQSRDFCAVVIRPATICGYSRRLRLDLSVNILTNHAAHRGVIMIFGGAQKRPHIHIQDVCDLYAMLLDIPDEKIAGRVFNAGRENATMADIGERVRKAVEAEMPDRAPIRVQTSPTNDLRSYHISSEKIRLELGFTPRRTVEDAVRDLCRAFREGRVPNPLDDLRYYNVRALKAARLK